MRQLLLHRCRRIIRQRHEPQAGVPHRLQPRWHVRMRGQREHALENAVAPRGGQGDAACVCGHLQRRRPDPRETRIRPRDRHHFRVEQDRLKPLMQYAPIAERLFEVRSEGVKVQQGLVDVAHDDSRHTRPPVN